MPSEPRSRSVLLVADPGLPHRQAERMREPLHHALQEALGVEVDLHVRSHFIPLREDESVNLDIATSWSGEIGAPDVVLMLTEIPRRSAVGPLIAELYPNEGIGVVSLPAFGARPGLRRLVRTLRDCGVRLCRAEESSGPQYAGTMWREEPDGRRTLHNVARTGRARLVLGMVASNEPWRVAPKLSGALAGASAAGAFGLFYNSIWQMSTYLSSSRLAFISVLSIVSMVAWLVISNRLWDRPVQETRAVTMLYNASTVLTVLWCVVSLYVALFVMILLAGGIVIDPEYMTTIVRHDATFGNYVDIAWLSASMGVVAGSLGSGFDHETTVRDLTHGQRERQRVETEEAEGSRLK